MVEPTSADDTLTILQNIRERYEQHHNVRFTDEALQACVTLTDRYVTDRNFPDKASNAPTRRPRAAPLPSTASAST